MSTGIAEAGREGKVRRGPEIWFYSTSQDTWPGLEVRPCFFIGVEHLGLALLWLSVFPETTELRRLDWSGAGLVRSLGEEW